LLEEVYWTYQRPTTIMGGEEVGKGEYTECRFRAPATFRFSEVAPNMALRRGNPGKCLRGEGWFVAIRVSDRRHGGLDDVMCSGKEV
jgi:hypothetical protein